MKCIDIQKIGTADLQTDAIVNAANENLLACGIGLYDNRRHELMQWPGKNIPGFTLMAVREQLRGTDG